MITAKRRERAIFSQTDIGTLSKAPLGKPLGDKVERIIMSLCGRTDTVLNRSELTAELSGVVGRLEGAAEALELEAGRLVPVTVGVVEAEGDLELVVLLRQGHLVVRVHIAVVEDLRGVQCSSLLSERCFFDTCQVLKQPTTTAIVVSTRFTWR